jgi:TonB family protein
LRLKLLVLFVCCALTFPSCQAKEYSLGAEEESKLVDAKVIDAPRPEIPEDFKDEAFKSSVTARFSISADGKFTVKLLDSCGNADIDKLVLSTLKRWKFQPATVDDKPVASSRKLKIELEVE